MDIQTNMKGLILKRKADKRQRGLGFWPFAVVWLTWAVMLAPGLSDAQSGKPAWGAAQPSFGEVVASGRNEKTPWPRQSEEFPAMASPAPMEEIPVGEPPMAGPVPPGGGGEPPAYNGGEGVQGVEPFEEIRVGVLYRPGKEGQAKQIAMMLAQTGSPGLESLLGLPVAVAFLTRMAGPAPRMSEIHYRPGYFKAAVVLSEKIPGSQRVVVMTGKEENQVGVDVLIYL
ncbi:MAG: hypothetical protein OEW12_04445 [Deltaproteobacteria bacterium]|nr:hypothetical protein [Deltaproteobacteria bacterium]